MSTPFNSTLSPLGPAVSTLEHLADRARETRATVQDQAARAGDRGVAYVRDEPVKSVLSAAAAGADVVALIGWMSRSRA